MLIVTVESRSLNELIFKIFYNKYIKANKPCHVFFSGKSGEGKSYMALKVMEIVASELEIKIDAKHLCNYHIIYDFEDFEKVAKHVFFSSCELPVMALMEGSVLAHARQFMSKRNILIGRIMSLSRTIRPIIFLICSQHWNDLDVYLRRRIDFFVPVVRYVSSDGHSGKPIAKVLHVGHALTDLVLGPVYVYHKPTKQLHRLHGLTFSLPSAELIREFEKKEKARKRELIEQSLELE
jgi:hypothetical protein